MQDPLNLKLIGAACC